jgi:formylglycine-generating enzyme
VKRLAPLVVLVGCARSLPPSGQIVLFVDTDAIVVSAGADPRRLAAQVDRARFEIVVDGATLGGSARVFPIDEELVRSQRLSFGIAPVANDASVAVRVRLYRADRVLEGDPPVGVTLDTTVTLPPVADEGIVELSILLSADDVGRAVGPVPAVPGRPPASRVGTWHGGRHVGCGGPPRDGEACVAGGSFFFGDPAFRGRTFANDIVDERLVTISPFFLDAREVTVAELRAAIPSLAGAKLPLARDPVGKTGTDADFCNWSDAPGAFEGLPVTCVPWETARAFCRAKGADLPSEAQFEYVTSGLGEERAFPWGDDEPDCTGSVWGRGGEGVFAEGSSACRTAATHDSAALPGSGARDRVDPSRAGGNGPELVDLGGNVNEWTLDVWGSPSETLWGSVLPVVDPVNTTAGAFGPDARPVRGGAWPFTILTNRAAFRIKREASDRRGDTGFRCARR